MSTITIEAPAKINLGLEILGPRPDGYHEIRTILAMLHLSDTLSVFESEEASGEDLNGVPASENLITRALEAFRSGVPVSPMLSWRVVKRIPSAAGLGGASSDAAAALLAANTLAGSPLTRSELGEIAGSLGSDITFFLHSPCAVATGRGTDLSPVKPLDSDVLVILPRETVAAKTATMYRSLVSTDFSRGDRVKEFLVSLDAGAELESGELVNAFSRPLRTHIDRIGELQRALATFSDVTWAMSGAGPAHYVLAPSSIHQSMIDSLTALFGEWLEFMSTSTRLEPIHVRNGAEP